MHIIAAPAAVGIFRRLVFHYSSTLGQIQGLWSFQRYHPYSVQSACRYLVAARFHRYVGKFDDSLLVED